MMLNKVNLIIIGTGNGAEKLYNGNIAQTFWKTGSNNKLRGYDYRYDQLNRLLQADFYNSEVQPYTGAYQESLSYDLNGNITSLFRTTGDVNGNAIDMDNLTYTYDEFSNQLLKVTDAVSSQDTGGFIDGNTNPNLDDYGYDANGNMIFDRNKGITEIGYNHLNLPTRITWTNNKYITYQYNALGQKVSKSVNHSDTIKTVNYLDGFQTKARGSRTPKKRRSHKTNNSEQYAGNVLQFFPTTEGYVKATPIDRTNTQFSFNYIYNYTDHLGNVRVSYTLDPQTGKLRIVDEHHYYPFGLRHEIHYPSSRIRDFRAAEGLNGGQVGEPVELVNVTKTAYQYKYNGKEWQDELGLNWLNYGWRNYMPDLGRWATPDPLLNDLRTTINFNQISSDSDEIDILIAFTNKMEVGGGVFNPNNLNPFSYGYNNPVSFDDPDGRCPICVPVIVGGIIGGVFGGGIEAIDQMITHGRVMDWTAVGASAVEGVITGAVAGATGGTSLGTTVAANGVASAVGGVAKREINGQETTVSDVAIDAIAGGAGGAAANKAKGSVEKMVITNTVGKTVVEKGSVAGARGVTKATVKEGGKAIKERSNSQFKGTAGTKSNGVKMDGGIQAAYANRSNPNLDKKLNEGVNLDRFKKK